MFEKRLISINFNVSEIVDGSSAFSFQNFSLNYNSAWIDEKWGRSDL